MFAEAVQSDRVCRSCEETVRVLHIVVLLHHELFSQIGRLEHVVESFHIAVVLWRLVVVFRVG